MKNPTQKQATFAQHFKNELGAEEITPDLVQKHPPPRNQQFSEKEAARHRNLIWTSSFRAARLLTLCKRIALLTHQGVALILMNSV